MTIYLIVFAGLLSFTNYIGSRVLMSLYVAAALLGLAFTFVSVAQQALIASLGDATRRARTGTGGFAQG